MASLTILIPCLSDSQRLEQTVLSVLTACEEPAQVVVVDRTGYSDPYGLSGSELEFIPASADAPLAQLLALGLARAEGEILHVVGGGLEVGSAWYQPAMTWFSDATIGSVSPACWETTHQEESGKSQVSLGISTTPLWQRREIRINSTKVQTEAHGKRVVGPAWYAAFYRTDWLRDVGGFDGMFGDEFVDLDVALRLQDEGATCIVEPRSVLSLRQHCESVMPSAREHGRNAQRLIYEYASNPEMTGRKAIWNEFWGGFTNLRRWGYFAGRRSEAKCYSELDESLSEDGKEVAGRIALESVQLDSNVSVGDDRSDDSYLRRAA